MNFYEQQRRDYDWLATELKNWFPWLGTDDEVSGADAIGSLTDLYEHAKLMATQQQNHPADQPVDESGNHKQQVEGLLLRAYKFDDKPHQLYSYIRHLAVLNPSQDTPEIVRLMDAAYVGAAGKDGGKVEPLTVSRRSPTRSPHE